MNKNLDSIPVSLISMFIEFRLYILNHNLCTKEEGKTKQRMGEEGTRERNNEAEENWKKMNGEKRVALSIKPLLPPITTWVRSRVPGGINARLSDIHKIRLTSILRECRQSFPARCTRLRERRLKILDCERSCHVGDSRVGPAINIEGVWQVTSMQARRNAELVGIRVVLESLVREEGVADERHFGNEETHATGLIGVRLRAVEDRWVENFDDVF